jgi:tetratricopeptide (TPR) repeat protein
MNGKAMMDTNHRNVSEARERLMGKAIESRDAGDIASAVRLYIEVAEIERAADFSFKRQATTANFIADLYIRSKRLDDALIAAQDALKKYMRYRMESKDCPPEDEDQAMATHLTMVGKVFALNGDYLAAHRYVEAASRIFRKALKDGLFLDDLTIKLDWLKEKLGVL